MLKLRWNIIQGLLEERFHRSRGLLDGYAGLEPRKRAQNNLPGIRPASGGTVERRGKENVVVAEVGHFELGRKNAHNDSGLPVECDRPPGKMAVTREARTP